jgi:hypothetical protein
VISQDQIEGSIKALEYHHFRGTTVVACAATLQNGYAVLGHSACADPAEFDLTLGQELAREDAYLKVAELLAFVRHEIQGELNEH